MPGPVFARGDRLELRTVEPADHEFLREHCNDPELRRWFGTHSPLHADDVEEWLDDEESVHFLPCTDGAPVGHAWLFRIRDVSDRAELGYWIAPEHQRNGYGTAAAELVVEYAFAERGCNRVLARVYEGNEGSRRVLETLGFEREGTLREHVFVGGEHRDVELYGLLAREW